MEETQPQRRRSLDMPASFYNITDDTDDEEEEEEEESLSMILDDQSTSSSIKSGVSLSSGSFNGMMLTVMPIDEMDIKLILIAEKSKAKRRRGKRDKVFPVPEREDCDNVNSSIETKDDDDAEEADGDNEAFSSFTNHYLEPPQFTFANVIEDDATSDSADSDHYIFTDDEDEEYKENSASYHSTKDLRSLPDSEEDVSSFTDGVEVPSSWRKRRQEGNAFSSNYRLPGRSFARQWLQQQDLSLQTSTSDSSSVTTENSTETLFSSDLSVSVASGEFPRRCSFFKRAMKLIRNGVQGKKKRKRGRKVNQSKLLHPETPSMTRTMDGNVFRFDSVQSRTGGGRLTPVPEEDGYDSTASSSSERSMRSSYCPEVEDTSKSSSLEVCDELRLPTIAVTIQSSTTTLPIVKAVSLRLDMTDSMLDITKSNSINQYEESLEEEKDIDNDQLLAALEQPRPRAEEVALVLGIEQEGTELLEKVRTKYNAIAEEVTEPNGLSSTVSWIPLLANLGIPNYEEYVYRTVNGFYRRAMDFLEQKQEEEVSLLAV